MLNHRIIWGKNLLAFCFRWLGWVGTFVEASFEELDADNSKAELKHNGDQEDITNDLDGCNQALDDVLLVQRHHKEKGEEVSQGSLDALSHLYSYAREDELLAEIFKQKKKAQMSKER